jgi:hypothetical protein
VFIAWIREDWSYDDGDINGATTSVNGSNDPGGH